MASSQLNKLYDEVRQKWVVAHPEEQVRQSLLNQLIYVFKCPKELIAVEKNLNELPFLAHIAPDRRADVIVFRKNLHSDQLLSPLLLIECKEKSCTQDAWEQLIGYNYFVKAPYIALVDRNQMIVADCRPTPLRFLSSFPSYEEMCMQ